MPTPPRALAIPGLCALLMAVVPSIGAADETSTSVGGVVYDALIERPFGLAETGLGLAITPIAYPLSLGTGRSDQVLDHCVRRPARYTFARSLGDFDERPRSQCGPVGLTWSVAQIGLAIAGRPLELVFGRSPLEEPAPAGPKDEIEI